MEHAVADLTGLLDQMNISRAAWLGYSMGGRVALQYAVAQPARVAALVLESASPGIADPTERAARVRSDEALADFVEREGLAAFVDRWERLPLFATQARLPTATRDTPAAGSAWRTTRSAWPTHSAGIGQGAQEPLHDRLGDVEAPTLLVVGEEDAKFRYLATEMASAMPAARVEVVAGSGHAPHLEQPHEFQRIVLDFLRSLDWQQMTREACEMTVSWQQVREYEDIIYERADGIAKITINRPEVRNAFRPQTVTEMIDAFADAREDQESAW